MKGVIVSGTVCGTFGFIVGVVLSVDGNVGSLVLGVVMAMVVVIVLGAIGILLVGVLTRNLQTKQSQRQNQFDQPQGPMLVMTGLPQQMAYDKPQYNQRQLSLPDSRQQVGYEDY